MTSKTEIKHRRLEGKVVSDKMMKTRVVEVERTFLHPRYLKRLTRTTRFKAEDSNNEYHVGDKVVIEETIPLSKDKRWIIIGKSVSPSTSPSVSPSSS